METKDLVAALAMADWKGVSIGEKALIQAAIGQLAAQDETIRDQEHQIRRQQAHIQYLEATDALR